MSLDKINQLVNSIAKIVESSEKVAIPILSVKLHKMAEAHPYDQTILSMASILDKMTLNKKLFMTKAEFKTLYNKFYSRNTKFAEYFKDELGEVATLAAPASVEKNSAPISNTHENFADPILTNALNSVFDKNVPLKSFSNDLGIKAKYAVSSNLDVWNLKASKLDIETGNEYFIVIKADYNTPKGVTSFFVPVEMNKGKILEPSIFMCNAGPQELNHVNIKNYLTTYAGAKLKVRAQDILSALTKEITDTEAVNNVEMAATKLASTKEHHGDLGGIIGQAILSPTRGDVCIPKSNEASSFATKFANSSGIAEFKFGSDKLNLGRDVVVRSLIGFGIKNPQINVVACDESTIFYGVSLFGGKTAFKVPVKVLNNKLSTPDVLICDGAISSFTKESISQLLVNGTTDAKVAASTSPQHNLSPAELVQNVKAAVSEENYTKAEDALNILQQSGNVSAYKDAFASYINGMGGIKKSAASEVSCNMIIKSANSSHALCGHTNLPLHKVYQDEHGNCQPLYRKGMKETSEGAFFMNAKIFG